MGPLRWAISSRVKICALQIKILGAKRQGQLFISNHKEGLGLFKRFLYQTERSPQKNIYLCKIISPENLVL